MRIDQSTIIMGALGLGIGIAAYVLLRGVKGVAKDAVTGVANAGAGVVVGIGDVIGIPETNKTQGEADIAAGDWWSASFNLPATDFIGAVWDHLTGKDAK